MRARIVEGLDSPWSGEIVVPPFLIRIGSDEYTPLDDLHGIVVEELAQEEQLLLEDAGFDLALLP